MWRGSQQHAPRASPARHAFPHPTPPHPTPPHPQANDLLGLPGASSKVSNPAVEEALSSADGWQALGTDVWGLREGLLEPEVEALAHDEERWLQLRTAWKAAARPTSASGGLRGALSEQVTYCRGPIVRG